VIRKTRNFCSNINDAQRENAIHVSWDSKKKKKKVPGRSRRIEP